MPHKHPEPSDPNMLVGVVVPGDSESMLEMAYTFAEEFACMGHDARRILKMFQTPRYSAAHGAYQALGAEAIERVVAECVSVYGRVRFVVQDAPSKPDDLVELRRDRPKARED